MSNPDINYYCFKKEEVLKNPYYLSFNTLKSFKSVYVCIVKNNKLLSIGESTALPGYSNEDQNTIYNWNKSFILDNRNKSPEDIINKIFRIKKTGFNEAPLTTAIETYLDHNNIFNLSEISVPVIGIINEQNKNCIKNEISELIKNYQTFKIKVGNNPKLDAEKVNYISQLLPSESKIRIDANQGYQLNQAIDFIKLLKAENIQFIEQPLPVNAWNDMVILNNTFPEINFMLDESIADLADVNKAADLNCCKYIKLKLFKCGSIKRMIEISHYINELNLNVIIGNGVQSYIGALYESYIYLELKKSGILLFDTELIGPLKIKNKKSSLINIVDREMKLFPKNIHNYYSKYLKFQN